MAQEEPLLESSTDDLRSALETAFDSQASNEPAPQVEAAPVEETTDSGPARDEKGRFASKTQTPVSDKTDVEGTEPASVSPSEPEPPVELPPTLSAEERALIATLPRELQAKLAEREGKRHREFHAKSEEAARARELFSVLEPVAQELRLEGKTPAAYVSQLVSWDSYIKQNPRQALLELCANNGINPSELVQAAPQVDPHVAQLQARLDQLEQERIAALQMQQQQHLGTLAQTVEKFKEGKEFTPELEAEMAPLVAHIRKTQPELSPQEVLQQAYERAVWANPATREKQLAAAKAKQLEEAKAAAAAAKKAGGSISGAPAGSAPKPAPDDLRGLLNAAFDGQL